MPAARIQQLPPNLVNRIAAGEVIERPASVVKECVENALDAGATRVTVEIAEGGKGLIRIADDGGGIEAADLPLAFASHATSKLRDDSELFAIRTMGFRGEALASIGSVSFAKIQSRTPISDSGFEISNRGGELSEVRACATNVGTIVEVRDLFFNVPARRKFLKGDGTEAGHVADALLKIALARPDVSFRLINNGKPSLELPQATAAARWLAAWPDAFASQHLSLDVDENGIRLRGLIGLPELAQPHLRNQFLFVNGRHVRDKFVGHALKESFRGLCEPGRNPAAVLMIDVPPDAVDVNVHPTKSEVRFRDSSRVHGFVMASVRALLLGNDLTPRAKPVAIGSFEAPRETMREQLADFFRGSVASPSSSTSGGFRLPDLGAAPQAASLPKEDDSAARLSEAPMSSRAAIQLHNSYLVAESDDGLVIIDQHALHERVLFEELLAKVRRGPLQAQRLLLPLTFGATPQQVDALASLAEVFAQLGVEASAIGPEAIAVHAFPSFLDKLDPVAFVRDAVAKVESSGAAVDHETLLRDTLDMMSCKAAVKAGDPLTPAEIEALLARRDLTSRASNCPHGRPTTLKLSLADLKKQFKRTGF